MMKRVIKVILKLIIKMLVLPLYFLSLVIQVITQLLANLGSLVMGFIMLLLLFVTVSASMSQEWFSVGVAAVMEVCTVGILFFSGIILALMQQANASIGKFLMS